MKPEPGPPIEVPKDKTPSKSWIKRTIAEHTGLRQDQVQAVLDSYEAIVRAVVTEGAGTIIILGGLKLYLREKPAREAQKVWSYLFEKWVDAPAKPRRGVPVVKLVNRWKGIEVPYE